MNTQVKFYIDATIAHPTDGGFVFTDNTFKTTLHEPHYFETLEDAASAFADIDKGFLVSDGFDAGTEVVISLVEYTKHFDEDGDIQEFDEVIVKCRTY